MITILIVEPNNLNFKLFSGLLESIGGINIIRATNSSKAINLAQKNSSEIKLVITETFGFEKEEGIRYVQSLRNILIENTEIIAITSRVMKEEIANYETWGFNGKIISKPINILDFISMIREKFGMREAA